MADPDQDPAVVAARVATKLIARHETVAIAESSAGGLISAALLAVPGASAYFLGGGVIYTLSARERLLGIAPSDMTNMRASTEAYARLLARRMRETMNADWSLSESGATGPTGNRYGDAAGHACFAVMGQNVEVSRTLETGFADRGVNMRLFAYGALSLLDEALTGS
jgi:nicotinamide-nucleotide amidase